jgi:GH18 family chitinase
LFWGGTLQRLLLIVVMLTICPFAATQTQKKVGWSLGYYPGWCQGAMPPASLDWKAFTHISHFALTAGSGGAINATANGLNDAYCKAAVAEAHKQGVKIVICIGGAGAASGLKSACASANIHKFVSNLVQFMKKYGYDGIDTDWEPDNGSSSMDNAEMLAWHKELRDSLDKIAPRPLLTIADGGYYADNCAFVYPYVDQMNTMSYDIRVAHIASELNEFTSRGVPKAKMGIGIGIGASRVEGDGSLGDGTPAEWTGKANFALNNGCGGIMEWEINNGSLEASCFKTLEPFINKPQVSIMATAPQSFEKETSLSTASNRTTGRSEISFSVTSPGSDGAFIDLSVFDLRGALIQRILHGHSNPGAYVIGLDQNGSGASFKAGTYIVRLSSDSKSEAAMISIVK